MPPRAPTGSSVSLLLLGGRIGDIFGRKRVFVVGLAGFATASGLGGLAQSFGVSATEDQPDRGAGGLVYGFSNAETHGWAAPLTILALAAAVALLAAFIAIERRVEHPLLPLRVVADRGRGGAYLAVAIVGAGMFGVFLFLTYYMQRTLGFSPLKTGLAFLPTMAVIMPTGALGQTRLVPRFGTRPLVTLGMVLGAAAMGILTGVTVHSSYLTHVLPGLLVMGLGLGLIMAPAMSTATLGVDRRDAGVASAMVTTGQQIGGSIGTALLSTLASTAAHTYATAHGPAANLVAQSAVHGYTAAFAWSAGLFAIGALASWLLLPSGAPALEPDASAELVFAH